MQSLAERLATLTPDERAEALAGLSDEEADALLYDWRGFLARQDQVAPDGDWDIWLALAGRGWGKTEVGARWVKEQVESGVKKIALVAETQKDLEEVMVARLLSIYPPGEGPDVRYKPVRLKWRNGAEALGYNGTAPDQLRGPEFEIAWVDELAKYRYARETWDMLQFCMRAGDHPRQLVTTTPRPIELIKAIVAQEEGSAVVTRGSTMDNRSNLSRKFLDKVERKYAGTRLGRQELRAEILGDLPGALWTQGTLDTYRVREAPALERVLVAVDPAASDPAEVQEEPNENGIAVVGRSGEEGFLLEDASMIGSPMAWAKRAIQMQKAHDAEAIVVEVNQGGAMVKNTIRSIDANVPVIEVRATKGKHVRAEPVSSLYEQGRIRHVGDFPDLEEQMTQMTTNGYEGEGSPDRVDAVVWGFTELFEELVQDIPDASIHMMGRRRAKGWQAA